MLREPSHADLLETAVDLESFVGDVELALSRALETGTNAGPEGPEVLMEAARNLILAGAAKRARPRLVYLFGRAIEAPTDALVDVAVAGELIHAGSLLHDDVVDGAETRRGRPTANALWGATAAVLAGDLVLTLAFVQLRQWPRIITSEAVETIATMSRGVMAEVLARGRVELPVDQWREIVAGKTGSLFAWCARSAARLVDEDDAAERFGDCAGRLGIAFQLADDLLDLQRLGSGKDAFNDILNREPTFPILVAADRSKEVRKEVARLWNAPRVTPRDAEALGRAVLATGAGAATVERLQEEITTALDALGPYAGRPGGREIVAWSRELENRARQTLRPRG
ncbi:MAG: polyprenyl synthetase family protein [Acidobacteriota bacterium]|jgi:geranylgeranyl pyrophosphate synthase